MALAAGAKIGPYEIVEPIGAGGMGEVYRARDTRLGRDVAVKVLSPSFAADPDRLRRFEQEARAAGALNHPGILAVYDVGTHDGAPYLVSEFLDGATLREKLLDGPLPPRKAIEIASAASRALSAAHESGIIHRDLKPENIFLLRDGRVKILDFGLAKFAPPPGDQQTRTQAAAPGAATEPGIVLGTVGYMSPEQVRGQPADARSDIFALGAILYEMLSGRRAFRKDSGIETMSAILKEEPPELSAVARNVPPGLERIVSHCLEKNPAERFQSARDLAFDLDALSGVSGSSAAQKAAPRLPPLRRRLIFAAVGTAGLVAACAVTYRLARRPIPPQPLFQRVTFRPGSIGPARFGPDGQTIYYCAEWQGGPLEVDSTRPGGPESRSLGFPAATRLASISAQGKMAVLLEARIVAGFEVAGTLAEVSLLGGTPREILNDVTDADWYPDGAQLAVVHDVRRQESLEFPIGKVLYRSRGGWLGDVRISPRGDRIAFANHPVFGDDGGTVAVVDTAGNLKTLTRSWDSLRGLAWSPSGDEIWFTASPTGENADLYAVSLSGQLRLLERMAGDLRLRDISRDGRVLAAEQNWRYEMRGGTAGGTSERDLSWLDWSLLADVSADGTQVLFTEAGEGGGPDYSVYLRRMDGSPALLLGVGSAVSLSPDGRWALAFRTHTQNQELFLLPTGAGEPRDIRHSEINLAAGWFPDSRRILFSAVEPNHPPRVYVQAIDGGPPRPVTPEGFVSRPHSVSPDGQSFFAFDIARNNWILYSLAGGAPRALPGLVDRDQILRWSADGRSLFLMNFGLPAKLFRYDPATGHRALLETLQPSDLAGVASVGPVNVSADGKSYAFAFARTLDSLYQISGLR